MSKYLYYGSSVAGIDQIRASSLLHGTDGTKVVYLTENRAYALFYIWDAEHNIKEGKHVTAWIRNGMVYYEEQFPEQLPTFYKGVSGYVYYVEGGESFRPVEGREFMWYDTKDANVVKVDYITDVYEELCRYENLGKFKVVHYNEVPVSRIEELYSHMAEEIVSKNLLHMPDIANARFYQTYFQRVWELAKEIDKGCSLKN